MKKRLFVYGSLKKNFELHQYLSKSKFIKDYTTENTYEMRSISDAYPIIAVDQYGKKIKGELYKVSQKDLIRIDQIETGAGYYQTKIEDDIITYIYPVVVGTKTDRVKIMEDTYEWVS